MQDVRERPFGCLDGLFLGSSGNFGEEVLLVAVPVSAAFDDFDGVVDVRRRRW